MDATFDLNQFFRDLHDNGELGAIAGTYKGVPAIGNYYEKQPEEGYISVCEIMQPNYQSCAEGLILGGTVKVDIKIVGVKCDSQATIRTKFNEMWCILRGYVDDRVAKMELMDASSVLVDPKNQRPYIASTWKIHFR